MLFWVFFVRARIGPKKWGGQIDPPPGKPRIGQHPGKGGVKVNSYYYLNVYWSFYSFIIKENKCLFTYIIVTFYKNYSIT